MPITAYIDDSARRALGMVDTRNFFKSVGSHEVAHQWWGHAVGFNSYRDQWMSEGFAHLSASIFMQAVYKDELFRKFWQDQRELLLEKSREGYRAIDVGPVTLGYRLLNSKTGFDIPQRLIYPKGAYVLHMLRMMMWDNKTRDEKFKTMMRDFVARHLNSTASTEDFKAIVEKHMTPEMDMAGNRRMDWFFNEYVYGTDLPDYRFEHNFTKDAEGNAVLWFKVTQANVHPSFMMRVPVYLELNKGQVMRLGSADLIGNTSFETSIPLKGLKDKPKRALINHYYDVLATYDGGKF
jgi:aminopeptidase N